MRSNALRLSADMVQYTKNIRYWFMWLIDFFKGLFAKKHIRLGLALGAGGAKGAALIGALKAFEEEGIKFDIVAGTSIGSVVGALYALGLDTEDMLSLLNEYGVTDAKKLLEYKFKGMSVQDGIGMLVGDKNFEDTELPFAAVATDLNTGEEVVMKHGALAVSLAASSAIPPIFRPVGRMNRRLVDGTFVNATPADVVKEMGADVVISINLTSVASNAVGKATLDMMYKGHGVVEADRLVKMNEYSDYIISPDLSAFKSTDVDKLDEMYSVGYAAAVQNMFAVKQLLTSKKVVFKGK